jgi:hypothetical protein
LGKICKSSLLISSRLPKIGTPNLLYLVQKCSKSNEISINLQFFD